MPSTVIQAQQRINNTIYVSPTGDPSGFGLSESSPTTLDRAYNLLKSPISIEWLNQGSGFVRVKLADGIYQTDSTYFLDGWSVQSTYVLFIGNEAFPENVVIEQINPSGNRPPFEVTRGIGGLASLTIKNPHGDGIKCAEGASLFRLFDVYFDDILFDCIFLIDDGSAVLNGVTKFTGTSNPDCFIRANTGSYIRLDISLDFSNQTVNFSNNFINTSQGAFVCGNLNYSNATNVSGNKFSEGVTSKIIVNGRVGSYLNNQLPGSEDGERLYNLDAHNNLLFPFNLTLSGNGSLDNSTALAGLRLYTLTANSTLKLNFTPEARGWNIQVINRTPEFRLTITDVNDAVLCILGDTHYPDAHIIWNGSEYVITGAALIPVVTTTGGTDLEVQTNGTALDSAVSLINFTGAGQTSTQTSAGQITVDIPAAPVPNSLEVENDGVSIDTNVAKINFGPGVVATQTSSGNVEVVSNDSNSLIIEDNGTPLSTSATKLNFTNFTITEPNPDEFDITAPASGTGGSGSGGTGVKLTNSTDTPIPAGTTVKIPFDTEEYDEESYFGTNTTDSIIPETAQYNISAQFATIFTNTAGIRSIRVHLNGNIIARREVPAITDNSTSTHFGVSLVNIRLTAGDVLDVRVFSSTATTVLAVNGFFLINKSFSGSSTTVNGTGSVINDRALAFQYEAEDKSDSISGRTLSTTGTVSLAAGKTGNAFSFTDNSANRLTAQASEDGHIFGNKDWFIGAWVNPATATGFKDIYAKDRFSDRPRVLNFFLDGTNHLSIILGFENNTIATYVSNAVISANVFTHVLATHNAETKTVELYVNGALDASFTYTETAYDSGVDIPHIGVRRSSTNSYDIPFNGLIDQLIKGDFIPTSQEISALNNSGNGVADAQSVFVGTSSSSGGSGSGSSYTTIDTTGFTGTPTSVVDGSFDYSGSVISAIHEGQTLRVVGQLSLASLPTGVLNFQTFFEEVATSLGLTLDYSIILPVAPSGSERVATEIGNVTINDISNGATSPTGAITGVYYVARRSDVPTSPYLHSIKSFTSGVSNGDTRWSGSSPVSLALDDVITFDIRLPVVESVGSSSGGTTGAGGTTDTRVIAYEPNTATPSAEWTVSNGTRAFNSEYLAATADTASANFSIDSPTFSGALKDVSAEGRFIANSAAAVAALSLRDSTTDTELFRIQISGGNVFYAVNDGSPQGVTGFALSVGVVSLKFVVVANNGAYVLLKSDRLASDIVFEVTGFTINSGNSLVVRALCQEPTLISEVVVRQGNQTSLTGGGNSTSGSTTSGTESSLTFTDTFTDVDGTAISAHALDTVKSPNWIPLTGDAAIQNNRAEVTVNNVGCVLGLPVGSINSGSISAVINTQPGNAVRGVFPRGSNNNNFLLFAINPDVNEIDVRSVVNGTFTKLQTVSKTINPNQDYELKVDFVGGFYEFYVDGILEITISTGEHINSDGYAGIRLGPVGDKADSFNLVIKEFSSITNSSSGNTLVLENNGVVLSNNVSKLNLTNFTISESNPDEFDITAPSESGGSGGVINQKILAFQYEAEDFSDEITGGPDLTVQGTVPIATGKVGNAFSFSGNSNNRLKLPNSSNAAYGNKNYFVAAWVNPSVSQSQAIIVKEELDNNRRSFFLGLTDTNNAVIRIGNGSSTPFFRLDGTATIPTGTWSHIVAVHNAANDELTLYVNGVSDNSGIYTGTLSNVSDPLLSTHFIGARNRGGTTFDNAFNGLIDQVIKGDFIPTLQEIASIYNSGDGVTDAQSVFITSTSGGGIVNSPSPQPVRESYVGATVSLADNASEDLDLTFPIAAVVANIATDVPSLIRAYSNKAARTADTRDNVTAPTIPTTGLIFEYRLVAGQLSEEILPVLGFVNLETEPIGEIYLRIFNESGSASAVSVSLEASPVATGRDRDSFVEGSLSVPKQLQSTDPYLQNLNPGTTADQFVYATDPPAAKDSFRITNTADPQDPNSKNILWSEDGGTTTHYTLEPGRYMSVHYGSQWRIFD